MAPNRSPSHPPFCHRWFADDVIITCVRWYLRFKLSYRDLAELERFNSTKPLVLHYVSD